MRYLKHAMSNEAYMRFQQNFNGLIIGLVGETLREKSLVGKNLMNRWLFVKFSTIFSTSDCCAKQYYVTTCCIS